MRRDGRDEPDPACFRCASRDCEACMQTDPAAPGSRTCCCGIRDERDDPWRPE